MGARLQMPAVVRQVVLSSFAQRPPRVRVPQPGRPERPASPVEEDSVLLDVTAFLRRNYLVVAAAAIVGAGLGLAVAFSQAPDYRATATIEIQDLNENFLNLKEVSPVTPITDSSNFTDVQTQLRILHSNALIERTLAKLPAEKIPPPKGLQAFWLDLRGGPSKVVPTQDDILDRVAQNLQLQETRQARIVDLTFNSPDPAFAAKFVNTLAQQYMDQTVESRLQTSQSTTAFLTKQLQELRDKLAQSQNRLQDYAQRSGLLITGQDRAPAAEKLRQVQTSLSNAQENRMVKQARLETVSSAPAESIEGIVGSSKKDYKTQLSDLRRQRADLLTVYQPDFAGVKRLDAQIVSLEASLKAESLAIVQDARNEYNDAVRRETLLRDSYVEQTAMVSQEAENAIQYGMLKNEVDSSQHLYEMILQRTAEAKVAAAMKASNTRIVDMAKTPRAPYRPSKSLDLLWGGTAGLLFGIVLSTTRERYDRRIKVPGELAAHLNVPELGMLPSAGPNVAIRAQLLAAGADQVITPDKRSLAVAESCRGILTSILFSDEVAQVPQILVITSAEHGEGKTTLATNLAGSLARMNRRVLLIDGDLRRPQLHTIFNVPNDYGLSDLLTLQSDTSDLIGYVAQPTSIPGVHVMAAGPHDSRALDMLYSAGTLNLLAHAREEFDTILIDTPPMLSLPDARVLGRMADGVVLVVRAGVTTRDSALAAKLRLDEDRTALLGTVLNNWSN